MDDPFTFGRIAAANAISDIYAMGGRPITAMNLAFFPACTLPYSILREIFSGGENILREAGTALVGGHTVEDNELKYGLSVTGLIDPGRVVRNSTARAGDIILLTKPLGTGIISTAIKGEIADSEQIAEAARWMTTLNRDASELMLACGVSAATDITGFGLIGHASEMALGSGVSIVLDPVSVPLMNGVEELLADGMAPAGCYRNRDFYSARMNMMLPDRHLPLFDPQTSGGMLIAASPESTRCFISEAVKRGLFAQIIGKATSFSKYPIIV